MGPDFAIREHSVYMICISYSSIECVCVCACALIWLLLIVRVNQTQTNKHYDVVKSWTGSYLKYYELSMNSRLVHIIIE